MGSTQNPTANPLVVCREEFDDLAVLFHPDTAETLVLNPVGVSIWKMLDGQHSIEQIAAELQDQFSEVPDAIADDVGCYVDGLAQRGFVSKG